MTALPQSCDKGPGSQKIYKRQYVRNKNFFLLFIVKILNINAFKFFKVVDA